MLIYMYIAIYFLDLFLSLEWKPQEIFEVKVEKLISKRLVHEKYK